MCVCVCVCVCVWSNSRVCVLHVHSLVSFAYSFALFANVKGFYCPAIYICMYNVHVVDMFCEVSVGIG